MTGDRPATSRAAVRAALIALLLSLAGVAATLAWAGRVLVVADPLPPAADAIVVMAGSIADRVLEAADLYRAGVAPQVLVTREPAQAGETALRARGVRLPGTDDLTLIALEQLGVPRAALVRLRRRTHSTESEARTIARYACRRRLGALVVVTSRAHSRRARLILQRTLGPGVTLAVRPSRYDPFPATRWWRVRRHAKTVLQEYQKLAHYWLRERWTIAPCGGLPAAGGRGG